MHAHLNPCTPSCDARSPGEQTRGSGHGPRAESATVCGPVRGASTTELLRRFVQAYWLRPENAFWMTIRSNVLARYRFDPPAIDVCCGDGVFSFLHVGGAFDAAFDVFTGVGGLDRVHGEHADMFDCIVDDYRPAIVSPPPVKINTGLDLKTTLLAKADRLGLYEQLIEHDSNDPLPLAHDTFQTVYCNAAYWVKNVDSFLKELARVTRPGGRVILQVKLESIRLCTLEACRSALGDRVLGILGRGRVESWPALADRATWEARFAAAGLTVEEAVPFITSTHAHIWDVGLRPIAPMLVRMANALTPQNRAAIKRDWVDLFCDLLAPLCQPDLRLVSEAGEPPEIQYVLAPGA